MIQQSPLTIQLKLIHAQLFQPPPCSSFTLTILHNRHQYNTSAFRMHDQRINLKECSPITFSLEESKQPLLRIAIIGCDGQCRYETQIEGRVVEAIVGRERKVNQRHVLAFPLFGKGSSVVGDLRIKLSIVEKATDHSPQEITTALGNRQRNTVLSQPNEEYFQPVYSRMIKVCIYQCPQQAQEQVIPPEQAKKDEDPRVKHDPFEPFREQISEIELRQSCDGRLNEQQQCEMAELANPIRNSDKDQQISGIPQDCRYLFQKINEINKRYAPLQKIPSQQQFSDYSELNQGDCDLGNESQSEQIVHPLKQVQDLLKQLDLYKFAQGLQVQPLP